MRGFEAGVPTRLDRARQLVELYVGLGGELIEVGLLFPIVGSQSTHACCFAIDRTDGALVRFEIGRISGDDVAAFARFRIDERRQQALELSLDVIGMSHRVCGEIDRPEAGHRDRETGDEDDDNRDKPEHHTRREGPRLGRGIAHAI